jgi:hypothetical protein
MRKIITGFIAFFLILQGCKNDDTAANKRDPLESGRSFIEASLKGDYVEAQKYLLQDSTNLEYFNGLRDFNTKLSRLERENYREANIIIDSTQDVSDSMTIITYSNTFKKVPSKLKMVKHDNEWLVDFKYTFLDSLSKY